MIETGDLRKGITLEVDGTLYQVLDVQHIKIGRGSAQVRMKLRDVRAGYIIEKTVMAGARFTRARVERQPAQYLYSEGDLHFFMNTETYDQFPLSKEQLGDALDYLKESATCELLTYGDEAIGVELTAAVELTVTETDLPSGLSKTAASIAPRQRSAARDAPSMPSPARMTMYSSPP